MATLPAVHPGGALTASDNTRLAFTNSANNEVKSEGIGSPASASYDSVSKSVAAQAVFPAGLAFKSDGTKMYVLDFTTATVYQYSLTAWDLSTASYDSVSKSVAAQDTGPIGLAFKSDGTKMYVLGQANNTVYQYSLTAWDLSTASYDSVSKSVAAQDTVPAGLAFKSDGTKMYVLGQANDTVYQYSLTAWDLSTASYDSVSKSVTTQDSTPQGIAFDSSGAALFVDGGTNDTVYRYNLSTAWDLSTATYGSANKSVSAQDTDTWGMFLKSDDTKLYVVGNANNTVYQYSLPAVIPSDFSAMATLSWTVEYSQVSRVDDTLGLDVRVMSGTTVLAAADSGGTYSVVSNAVTNTTDTTAGPTAFAYVNTTATKAQWEAAQVDLRQRYSASKSNDGAHVQVDFVELTGTYTASGPTVSDVPLPYTRRRAFKGLIVR